MLAANDLLRLINRLVVEQPLIIVEGKKDEASLKTLGLSNIVTLTKPLYAVVEDAARQAQIVVILTDLDSKGKELYGVLRNGLQRHGIKIDDGLRKFLLRNTPLRQIEGLATFVENLHPSD
ncbi:hypothetical protein HY493_04115 [Candidatus Woesearchaeota archaeon]|nr:hypothetical protein [Candidatus Woesearchaeota archaeon]